MPNMTTDVTASRQDIINYWAAARRVVNAAGKYAAAVKLKENLLDPSTAHKVQHVLDDSFDGSMAKLDDAINQRSNVYYAKVRKFNVFCRQYDLYIIGRPSALLSLLMSERKRESFRGKIKTRIKNGKLCALQSFEMPKRKGPK